LPKDLSKVATASILSEIETVGTTRRTRLWELWWSGWVREVELPKLNFPWRPGYRWEVLFLARPSHSAGNAWVDGRIDWNTISHVSRNALDFRIRVHCIFVDAGKRGQTPRV
jgi:hypothetical protein